MNHTKENPADKACRGLSAEELLTSHGWWNGPEFVRRPLNEQVGREELATISDGDPEVRRSTPLPPRWSHSQTLLSAYSSFPTGIEPGEQLLSLSAYRKGTRAKKVTGRP